MQELIEAIEKRDIPIIKQLMKEHDLVIEGNKIVPQNKSKIKSDADYWDTMQYIRK